MLPSADPGAKLSKLKLLELVLGPATLEAVPVVSKIPEFNVPPNAPAPLANVA